MNTNEYFDVNNGSNVKGVTHSDEHVQNNHPFFKPTKHFGNFYLNVLVQSQAR